MNRVGARPVLFLSLLIAVAAVGSAGEERLTRTVPPDAGSAEAPLLIAIGLHIEPLGATVSALATGEGESGAARSTGGGRSRSGAPRDGGGAREGGARDGRGPRAGGPGGRAGDYRSAGLFDKHLRDIRTLVELVERHGGKIVAQAQTPFTETLAAAGDPLFQELEAAGHEVALHFHEDAHLGRGCERLPAETWTAVMKEETERIRACGATKIAYWSGGNLYAGVLDAAAAAGLSVMSDYKNPRKQESNPAVIALHPWRPAGGPTEADLSEFAHHDAEGPIVYLPGGLFTKTNYAAARRSEEAGGDRGYFDFLTECLEASLRGARTDRVNTFHVTVHPGEFRGRGEAPFAVIEEWLTRVVDPLVKQGKVRWATYSEMAAAYRAWEKRHPQADPRGPSDPEGGDAVTPATEATVERDPGATPAAEDTDARAPAPATEKTIAAGQSAATPTVEETAAADPRATAPAAGPDRARTGDALRAPAHDARGTITFAINVHDFCDVASSADTLLRAIDLFVREGVRGDFYLTGSIARKYAEQRPDVIARLRETAMTISYHVRPPHPLYAGFEGRLQGLDDAALARTLRDYETFDLDLRTGELDRSRPGGYAYVKELFGRAPVVVGAPASDPRIRAAALAVYRELGARMTVAHHETGTDPEQPFEYRGGLLMRPSDFSVTRWKVGSMAKDNFWWNMVAGRNAAAFDPSARLDELLAEWDGARPPFATALIHENNFYNRGPEAFTAIYWEGEDKSRPANPPFDLEARGSWSRRPEAEQEKIWRAYEALVKHAKERIRVATSEEIVGMAMEAGR